MSDLHGPEADDTQELVAGVPLAVEAAGRTDPGRIRPDNEDQFLIAELTERLRVEQSTLSDRSDLIGAARCHLFLVADGMGGHAAGEVASKTVARAVEEVLVNSAAWFLTPQGAQERQVVTQLQRAVREAEARVLQMAKKQPELRGMGTTLTMALAIGRALFVAHVGDSRAYLLRAGRLLRLTNDHTLVNELAARGALVPGHEVAARFRHVITNAIGGSARVGVRVEAARAVLEPDDRLLLCTDGLTDLLADEAIASVMSAHPGSQAACHQLVAAANDRGGHDNITVVVASFTEPLAA
jgi:protein phosphatase